MISQTNRMLGAILLVSGTTIGAGMLALPVTTGLAGFVPSLIIMTAVWLFMMLTAFYFLEVNLRMKGESNLISMMRRTLGRPGEVISWVTYLLLLYALTAAYLLGCSQIINDFFYQKLFLNLSAWVWPLVIFILFGSFVYLGTTGADLFNRFMMVGLVISYIALTGVGCCKVTPQLLTHVDWAFLFPSLSVVVTSFGFHVIIPTLTTYLDHDVKLLKWSIFLGSLIPFLVYVLWQFLVMGVVPVYGEISLSEAAEKGLQITFFLRTLLGNPWIGTAVRAFAFFAIITSLLGVSLSLTDFLADGLKIKRTPRGKLFLVLMTFVPPLFFTLFFPQGFIIALEYAGILVVLLLALLPALMAWVERYGPKPALGFEKKAPFQVPGGKIVLGGTIFVSLVLLGIEIFV